MDASSLIHQTDSNSQLVNQSDQKSQQLLHKPAEDELEGSSNTGISNAPLTDNHIESNLNVGNAKISSDNTDEQKKDHYQDFVYESSNVFFKNSSDGNSTNLPSPESALMSPNQIANKLLGQREELMQLFMVKRQDDYISRISFRVFVGTWNVNGQYPPTSVHQWTAADPEPPDLYAIGFQELDLSKEAFVFSESLREEEWLKVVTKSLHPKSTYQLVKLVRLVGMMLLVFVAKKHASEVTDIASHYVGTGLLGRMGNKGAVGVRFNLYSSTICFVNSHLAANAELTQRRNEDYEEIVTRMRFADPQQKGHLTMFQHDFLIWLGDLNYRIDGLQPDHVKELIGRAEYKLLKENDQLLCQRREGNVFTEFEEGDITFRPTYKYNPGSDVWDTSEKCRTPAWCDRVLWREPPPTSSTEKKKALKSIHLTSYRSHPKLKISDHKPVSAVFDLDVKVIDESRYKKVYEEEIRRLDRMENDYLPAMTLSCHSLEFDDVTFQRPVTRSVELQNTGQVPCHFEFIAKFEEKNFCKPWLTISNPKSFIMPGESKKIDFEVYVNRTTASNLNLGLEKIEDILILHLVGGKDFFITVSGQYLASFFGMPLHILCQLKKPVRDTTQSEIKALNKVPMPVTSQTSSSSIKVPKELFRILDHLYNNALKQSDLFQQPGLHKELQEIQENLDSNQITTSEVNKLPGSNHSVVEALLVFLESLPEPVIPFQFYTSCLEVFNEFEKAKALVEIMPECHRYVFFYLIAFLQELLKYRDRNGLGLQFISNVFSGLVLRPRRRKSTGSEARAERQKATKFIENFLVNPIEG